MVLGAAARGLLCLLPSSFRAANTGFWLNWHLSASPHNRPLVTLAPVRTLVHSASISPSFLCPHPACHKPRPPSSIILTSHWVPRSAAIQRACNLSQYQIHRTHASHYIESTNSRRHPDPESPRPVLRRSSVGWVPRMRRSFSPSSPTNTPSLISHVYLLNDSYHLNASKWCERDE